MAGRGNTIPKDPAHRRRQNKPTKPKTVTGGQLLGPDLPLGIEWHAQTRIWWDNWRRSAQAAEFTPTDWDFLLDSALLHTQLWDGDTSVGAELRLRLTKLGATAEDRKRLNIKVEEPEAPADKPRGGAHYGHLRPVQNGA